MDNLVLEVTDYLAIKKAKIEINKINVVGGTNSSGKSTLSKIFYSLLKGNSAKRREYALQNIIDDINLTIEELNSHGNEYNLPKPLKINDNNSYIKKTYNEVLEIYKKHQKMAEIKIIETTREIVECVNNLAEKLENNGFDVKNLKIVDISPFDDDFLEVYSYDVSKAIQEYNINISRFYQLSSFCKEIVNYETIFDRYDYHMSFLLTEEMQKYFNDIYKIEDLENLWVDLFEIISGLVYFPILDRSFKRKMDVFFGEDSVNLSRDSLSEIFTKEHIFDKIYPLDSVYGINFELYHCIDTKIDAFDYFFNNGFISSVYYIDNLSLIDLWEINKNFHLFHNDEILEVVNKKRISEITFKSDICQKPHWRYASGEELKLNQDVMGILEKIENIIYGNYKDGPFFSSNKKIKDSFSIAGLHIKSYDTASGVKQIGIIELLLRNDKLKKGGYLIIDEPEVNLHPDWQFKFAEILVLLAKDLDITIYLNTHSPFFIEAIDAFTEFYDMQDDINYYLTVESEVEGKYDFAKIESNELYRIYDNLGNAYDLINQLRLRKRLEK